MGLFDTIKDKAMEGMMPSGSQGLMGIVTTLLQQTNGVSGLMQKFQNKNMGNIFNSWVGTGENQPIQPDQVQDALGPETVDQLSQSSGMPKDSMLQQLSQYLPTIVDKLTPNGQMPTGGFSKESLLSMAGNMFKKAS
jgi:uncharacterized protein YidB (DUF937 family)